MGTQPSVPVVTLETSLVGSQPRFTTMEPPNASTDPTGLPPGSASQLPCPDDMFDSETVNYDTILQFVLFSLNRPDLYTQEARQPLSVWDASSGRPVQPGVGSLALDVDMQAELGGAFGEPTVSTKHVSSTSQFKVPSDVYASLFKAPRVDEELLLAIGTSRAPPHSSELKKAFDKLYESSMVSWRLGWHLTVLSQFL